MDLPNQSVSMVLFWLGEWRVGVEASQVRGVRPGATSLATLHPKPVNQRPLVGQPLALLFLDESGQEQELPITGPVELVTLPVHAIHPLPPLLAARMGLPGLRALTLEGTTPAQGVILLFESLAKSRTLDIINPCDDRVTVV